MTPDPATARNFYGELFGWDYQVGGEDTGFYAIALRDGHRVAGVGPMMMEGAHPAVWTTYLASSDVDSASKSVADAGGTVVGPAMDVMDFGRMAVVSDPSRATFGLWQAGKHIGTELVNEPGALMWNELLTRDYEGAKQFYTSVFGYTYTEIGDEAFRYSTVEVDGGTVGGLGLLPAEVPDEVPPHWLTYFCVDDVDTIVDRAVALGGAVQRPAADMPYGRHAGLADPAGAGFAVIKPTPGPQN
jgi:hypothetical protein